MIPGETFHTDHSNHPAPPKATTLFAVDLPSRGGDTQYVNMHDAYDDLPAATKQRIDELKAVHVYQSKYSPRACPALTRRAGPSCRRPAFIRWCAPIPTTAARRCFSTRCAWSHRRDGR